MATGNTSLLKKMFTFSDPEIRTFIENILIQDSDKRGISQSAIIEEYVLQGIARSHPEVADQAKKLYGKRYLRYLDPFMLNSEPFQSLTQEENLDGTN